MPMGMNSSPSETPSEICTLISGAYARILLKASTSTDASGSQAARRSISSRTFMRGG